MRCHVPKKNRNLGFGGWMSDMRKSVPIHSNLNNSENCDEDNFISTVSDVAETFPKKCSDLRKNEHVIIRDRPCKIIEISTSTGKHGQTKVHLVAIDIFTNKKLEDICLSTHNIEVPAVKEFEYILISIEDGYCSLMDPETCDLRNDLTIPEGDLGNSIREVLENGEGNILVQVVAACGEEAILGYKQE